MTDFFYMIHMCLQFRTGYIEPSTRVFGRGDLVTDPKKIAARYLRKDFWLDLVAVLPIPQVCAPTTHALAALKRKTPGLSFLKEEQVLTRKQT